MRKSINCDTPTKWRRCANIIDRVTKLAHMNQNDLLSAEEAAATLGVSRATLNRWADAGTIRVALKMPGRTGARLFDRSDIEKLKAATA